MELRPPTSALIRGLIASSVTVWWGDRFYHPASRTHCRYEATLWMVERLRNPRHVCNNTEQPLIEATMAHVHVGRKLQM